MIVPTGNLRLNALSVGPAIYVVDIPFESFTTYTVEQRLLYGCTQPVSERTITPLRSTAARSKISLPANPHKKIADTSSPQYWFVFGFSIAEPLG